MSNQSERVKIWRRKTKSRLIKAMGGKCIICGYDKCHRAMAFHHLDPSKKEFSISDFRANSKSWESIIQEIRKTILVCNNCHCEIHDGITAVPNVIINFD